MDDEKFLNFEEPIKELAQKLSALRTAAVDSPALNDEILNLDFLEFVNIQKRKKKDRLFEELKPYKGHNYANSVQRFWNERYTRDLGIEDADGKRVTFHSLRHVVADTLKQANVETKFINEQRA